MTKTAIITIAAIALLASCRSMGALTSYESLTTATARTDTVRLVTALRDSVRVSDSVYIKEWRAGDTVFLTKTATRYRDRDRIVRDTVYESRTDTLRVTGSKRRERESREATWGTVALVTVAALALLALDAWIIVRKGKDL